MKITVELELDMDAYNAKYGPGTEWWTKYRPEVDPETYELAKPDWADEAVKDILHEGFYDWDSQGWMKVSVS